MSCIYLALERAAQVCLLGRFRDLWRKVEGRSFRSFFFLLVTSSASLTLDATDLASTRLPSPLKLARAAPS